MRHRYFAFLVLIFGAVFVGALTSTATAGAGSQSVAAHTSSPTVAVASTIVIPSTEDVQTTVLSQAAGDTLDYGLEAPTSVDVCDACRGAESSDLGTVSAGTALVFYLTDATAGATWASTDPTHASVTEVASNLWSIRWDDAGGDLDYNDLITQVHAGPATATSLTELLPNVGVNQTTGTATAFTIQVTGGATSPTGMVSLAINGSVKKHAVVDADGQAFFSLHLPAGTDILIATYHGDGSYSPSSDGATINVFAADSTVTSATVSPTSPVQGKRVTFTVTMTAGKQVPTGSVQFSRFDNDQVLGSAELKSGTATFSHIFKTSGTYRIEISYAGKAGVFGPVTEEISFVVNS